MKNKYLHWVVICVIIGATFFCAQFFGTQYQNTNSNIQSGASSTGIVKPIFHQPNTEWKTRTITLDDGRTLTYEFGKGNPVGTNPLNQEEKEAYKKCYYNTMVHDMDCPPLVSMIGYVTPDIEKGLYELVTHPNWKGILVNCEQQFHKYEDPTTITNAGSGGFVSYATMLNGVGLDIDNLLLIDKRTGRKMLAIDGLINWFRPVLLADAPVTDFVDIQTLDNCITRHGGGEIIRMIDNLDQKLYYPEGIYPQRITNPEYYLPLYL